MEFSVDARTLILHDGGKNEKWLTRVLCDSIKTYLYKIADGDGDFSWGYPYGNMTKGEVLLQECIIM